MNESEKLQAWIDAEKANGLVDFKFTLGEDRSNMTLESVAKELNAIIAAPPLEDKELF